MNKNKSAKFAAVYGMLIALAFVLSFIESLIPISLGIPGVKLGLANLVTIVGLYTIGIRGTVVISLLRIVLVGFTFGNMFALFYSLAGWGLSLFTMAVCKKFNWFGTTGISILGGIAHNIGQICVASIVVQQVGIFYYLPMLLLAGTVAGLVIGLLGGLIITRINHIIKNYMN
ncbi:Gx transporter family protein [Clostridium sp. E02]|uniref:Gx transporter family protein n=1 Tax=Clostridium sp. E02 TaxID=2487134 RepID=UPI000F520B88|nr:Gx transporter family protein [Clostridium sp. E02]